MQADKLKRALRMALRDYYHSPEEEREYDTSDEEDEEEEEEDEDTQEEEEEEEYTRTIVVFHFPKCPWCAKFFKEGGYEGLMALKERLPVYAYNQKSKESDIPTTHDSLYDHCVRLVEDGTINSFPTIAKITSTKYGGFDVDKFLGPRQDAHGRVTEELKAFVRN